MAKTASTKKPRAEREKGPAFEHALERLEEIVELLDDGNLPLDQSLALFKEGTALAKTCRDLLAEAEVQVKEALRESGGDEDEDADEDDGDDDEADDDEDDDDKEDEDEDDDEPE